ncbi:3-oxoacyl-ACP synthase [Hyphomicrobium nitrativorans NL23]|uniref:3-oxoacyl-ACP synthase n=1 Tax=Hyphomicrobium nitrativorans NL23 TaxID=1029756 RepID=V5SDV2_9HYPH|nr:beta-ketoacyl-ACP synthase [Hyphomicrobium nitrativorans]AHB48230.1 3-oxoacyl-ACP synthase [Hyphomicrobium nitrativorans NL23]
MAETSREVWITGIGLVSSLAEGAGAHWQRLADVTPPRPVIDSERFAPYAVHPLVALDFAKQIPRTSDRRQMERWQQIGVYTAGLALADAGLAGDQSNLDRVNLTIAAGNGERDLALDARVLTALETSDAAESILNRELAVGLRPTLYLGQLSNLLAGNISIVHKATGSSRTFKGEELAGVSAVTDAARRIAANQGDVFLAGGALNAEREDLLLGCEITHALATGPYRSVWERGPHGGGLVPGSMGAFLVLEASDHARSRGAVPYARLSRIVSDRALRHREKSTDTAARLFDELALQPKNGHLSVLSGASGVEPVTADEKNFLERMEQRGFKSCVRTWGSVLGHGIEAHFIAGLALAALAISKNTFYPPFAATEIEDTPGTPTNRILVTCFGHWRGEGLALVESAHDAAE